MGKGGGYSEIEYAVLASFGKVDVGTHIVTSVLELQIVPKAPMEEHDFTVDHIATPARLVKMEGPTKKASGIIQEVSLSILWEMRDSHNLTKSIRYTMLGI
jgi:5-formyltetrahydrofolate cyclo-ligase